MMPNKKKNNITEQTPIKLYLLFGFGCILLMIPIISFLVDPMLIIIKHLTRIEKGSQFYNLIKDQELPGAIIEVYVFNITNSEDFLAGKDHKLKIEEVGPFTYQEFRKNKDFEFDEEAEVMRYTPHYRTEFILEKSIGDPHYANITAPNSAMLAAASMISPHAFWIKSLFNTLVTQVRSKPIINVDVHSYLWGYNEPLVTIGNTLMPGWITFRSMGLLDRLYDQSTVPRVEVKYTGKNKFAIKTLNGSPGLDVWDYNIPNKRTRCNTLVDTYEGIAYPPGINTDTKLRMYRNVFCRMLDLEYTGTRTMDYGPTVNVYKFSDSTFKVGPDTECLCKQNRCQDGISDMSPCMFGLGIVLSNAHFLYADPKLYERFDGIHPDKEQHGSEILVDPKVGAVLKARLTLQVNIDVQNVNYNMVARPFTNMTVPVAYVKIVQADIPEEGKEIFKNIYYKMYYIVHGVEFFCILSGILVLIYVARRIYQIRLRSENRTDFKTTNGVNIIHLESLLREEKSLDKSKVVDYDS